MPSQEKNSKEVHTTSNKKRKPKSELKGLGTGLHEGSPPWMAQCPRLGSWC